MTARRNRLRRGHPQQQQRQQPQHGHRQRGMHGNPKMMRSVAVTMADAAAAVDRPLQTRRRKRLSRQMDEETGH
jgi:hypothetical protein